jgi:hypothetical protein
MQDVHVKLYPGFPWQKQHLTRRRLFSSKLDLISYILTIYFYGPETWTLWKVDQKHLESFEMWCWRRMEISWTDSVKNEEVLHRAKEERNILHTIK